ncbi:universal stress protein [Azospirillum soli]|uniref:universal stress protein n=1 Tax=Azospirillum soli TaxID=1304799 RepID=UPI001AEAF8C6|nr:universal stress protein [Azospirillum soli]MBP2315582.1 nucleotide-binding universal stress UspA family protein [Azospirillum soli]
MPFKTILVHVDTSAACANRLQIAADLARRFGARLIGAGLGDADLETSDAETVAPTERDFLDQLRRADLPGLWLPISGLEEDFIVRQAQTADLVIVGQRDPELTAGLGPEGVIVACGRPVLVVPYATACERVGDTALIAWNGSREATRAVHDARPLLERSKDVVVLSVRAGSTQDSNGRSLAYDLTQRGVRARAETVDADKRAISSAVQAKAMEIGADLIVMGAYRRSPLDELFRGGMTDAMLRGMTLPVLMAH